MPPSVIRNVIGTPDVSISVRFKNVIETVCSSRRRRRSSRRRRRGSRRRPCRRPCRRRRGSRRLVVRLSFNLSTRWANSAHVYSRPGWFISNFLVSGGSSGTCLTFVTCCKGSAPSNS